MRSGATLSASCAWAARQEDSPWQSPEYRRSARPREADDSVPVQMREIVRYGRMVVARGPIRQSRKHLDPRSAPGVSMASPIAKHPASRWRNDDDNVVVTDIPTDKLIWHHPTSDGHKAQSRIFRLRPDVHSSSCAPADGRSRSWPARRSPRSGGCSGIPTSWRSRPTSSPLISTSSRTSIRSEFVRRRIRW
jgi:hypothetical protein